MTTKAEDPIHTSICLSKELHEKIKASKRPMNSIVTEALDDYFNKTPPNEDEVKRWVKDYLESEEMQTFYRNEILKAIIPAVSAYIPKFQKGEIAKKLGKELVS